MEEEGQGQALQALAVSPKHPIGKRMALGMRRGRQNHQHTYMLALSVLPSSEPTSVFIWTMHVTYSQTKPPWLAISLSECVAVAMDKPLTESMSDASSVPSLLPPPFLAHPPPTMLSTELGL